MRAPAFAAIAAAIALTILAVVGFSEQDGGQQQPDVLTEAVPLRYYEDHVGVHHFQTKIDHLQNVLNQISNDRVDVDVDEDVSKVPSVVDLPRIPRLNFAPIGGSDNSAKNNNNNNNNKPAPVVSPPPPPPPPADYTGHVKPWGGPHWSGLHKGEWLRVISKKLNTLDSLVSQAASKQDSLIEDIAAAHDLHGPPGIRGETGRPGLPGPRGPRGVRGIDGLPGQPGVRGATAPPGPRGFRGPRGPRGAPGLNDLTPGLPGTPGKQGPQGLPGVAGAAGIDGVEGAPGATGMRGTPGQNGLDGARGPEGPYGLAGQQGPRGKQGLAGKDATINGIPGKPGTPGKPGKPGYEGPQGPAGPPGPPGLEGVDGVRGKDGRNGANGAAGQDGLPGPAGAAGVAGADGAFVGAWGGSAPPNSRCVFPFTYKGQQMMECTTMDRDQPWCFVDKEMKKWGFCSLEIKVSGGNSLPGDVCSFPFDYEGTEFNSCISNRYKQSWCYTTPDKSRWGICDQAATGGTTGSERQQPCRTQCTSSYHSQPWCYTDVRSGKWGNCIFSIQYKF